MYLLILGTMFVFSVYPAARANSRTNFNIKRFERCNKTQGLIYFEGNITTEGNNQFLTYTLRSPIPIDEHVGVTIKIDYKITNSYVELFVIREKNACKAGKTYGGEFWYDLQRAAQIIPGQCPIRAGRYHVDHLLLDFQKISLQTFPFGEIRFTGGFVENKNPQTYLFCFMGEVENVIN